MWSCCLLAAGYVQDTGRGPWTPKEGETPMTGEHGKGGGEGNRDGISAPEGWLGKGRGFLCLVYYHSEESMGTGRDHGGSGVGGVTGVSTIAGAPDHLLRLWVLNLPPSSPCGQR